MAGRRILFIVPPMVLNGDFIDYPWAADMGALYCAARAAAAGWQVDVFDSLAQPDSGWFDEGPDSVAGIPFGDVAARLPDVHPDLVVIANHPFFLSDDGRAKAGRLTNDVASVYPDSPVILADCAVGGMMYVTRAPEDLLAAFPDVAAIIAFSGESAFSAPDQILASISGGVRYIAAPAVAWTSPPPFPMYEAIDIGYRYAFNLRFYGDSGRPNPFCIAPGALPMLASAGCAHNCVFCTTNPGRENCGPGAYRTVPLDALEDHLYLAKKVLGCRRVIFLDDAANLRSDFKQLLALLVRLDLGFEFPNGLRADRLDDESIAMMKGRLTTLSVSCETADDGALRDLVGKALDTAAVERVAVSAKAHGVPLMIHFIIGFPWETLADVRKTLDFARRLHEEHGAVPAVQFATPVPGSRMWQMLADAGIPLITGNTGTSTDAADAAAFQHHPSFVPPAMKPGELEASMQAFQRRVEAGRASKVIINVTYECLNACEFCAVSNRVKKSIPTGRISEILGDHRKKGIQNVDFDGGEPLLHPGIFEVIGYARAIGYTQINVTSNGRKLADAETARALVNSGVTSILISLHGDTAEIHDGVTGKTGSFDETLGGIANILMLTREALRPIDFGVNVTICGRNLDHIEPLAVMMADMGVPKMNFQFLTPFGAASVGLVPDPHAAARVVSRVIDAVGDRMKIYVVNAQMCLFDLKYERYLLNDLQKLGRTMVFVWEEEVNLFNYLADKRERRPECTDCPHFLVCDGFYSFPEVGADQLTDDGGVKNG